VVQVDHEDADHPQGRPVLGGCAALDLDLD